MQIAVLMLLCICVSVSSKTSRPSAITLQVYPEVQRPAEPSHRGENPVYRLSQWPSGEQLTLDILNFELSFYFSRNSNRPR
ncbi:hypothetical protein BDU57DRAFT_26281 [Ampelomyces quisqualis]|uniref:Uncharacterized protein n=1 Tax=Ampelomyces quisqualis TaxID=50730 RepID=A0A6A5R210_AMPQU|nr:hypothetical protein BDU57DRAFT_26281 [Ampelomyces quisqualis]